MTNTARLLKKSDFKRSTFSRFAGTRTEYIRQSLADAAVVTPANRNFDRWYLKRFNMGWVDLSTNTNTNNPHGPTTAFISYTTRVAHIYHQTHYVLIDARYKKYSQSTSRHLSALHWATHASAVVPFIEETVSDITEPLADSNAAYFAALLRTYNESMRNTRKRPQNRVGAYNMLCHIAERVARYQMAFGSFTPTGVALIKEQTDQGYNWGGSEQHAVCVARAGLNGLFLG